MKGRYIQITGGKKIESYQFDRQNLLEGYTSEGRHIPAGGVLLSNGNLAGYLKSQEGGNWTIIGKIDNNDPNSRHIPLHQSGGKGNGNKISTRHGGSNQETPKKQVSLKTAVKMLREYYRHNFN